MHFHFNGCSNCTRCLYKSTVCYLNYPCRKCDIFKSYVLRKLFEKNVNSSKIELCYFVALLVAKIVIVHNSILSILKYNNDIN